MGARRLRWAGSRQGALLALLATLGASMTTFGQGTAISYYGQLSQAGAPAEGTCDLRATLYPALSGGTAIAPTVTLPAVQVLGGGFTVDLDFGAGTFNGQPRWLELAVRPAGSGSYTPLLPRQALNAVPYALYALTPAGPQGAIGPKGDAGPVGPSADKCDPGSPGLSWKGPWSDAASYSSGDVGYLEGASWVAKSSSPIGNMPHLLSGQWTLLADHGAVGPKGDPGTA